MTFKNLLSRYKSYVKNRWDDQSMISFNGTAKIQVEVRIISNPLFMLLLSEM